MPNEDDNDDDDEDRRWTVDLCADLLSAAELGALLSDVVKIARTFIIIAAFATMAASSYWHS